MISLAGLASPSLLSPAAAAFRLEERDWETPRSLPLSPTADTRADSLIRSQEHAPGPWMALSIERARQDQERESQVATQDGQDGGERPSSSANSAGHGSSTSKGNAAFEFYDPRGLFTRRRSTLNSDGSKERAALKAESARASAGAGAAPSPSSSAILSPTGSVVGKGSTSPLGARSAVSSSHFVSAPLSIDIWTWRRARPIRIYRPLRQLTYVNRPLEAQRPQIEPACPVFKFRIFRLWTQTD
jgi:hypothetical protein